MDKSQYFSIDELAKRWDVKKIDVWEKIRQDNIPYRTNNPATDRLHDEGFVRLKKNPDSEIAHYDRPVYINKTFVEEYERKHPGMISGIPIPINNPPPYLNPDHEYYSGELAIAVTTWLAFYENGELNKRRGHRDQIEKYLKEHYKHALGINATERIITVVNRDCKNKKIKTPPSHSRSVKKHTKAK